MAIIRQNHSILVGTMAELIANGGDYTRQKGWATDLAPGRGLQLEWSGTLWRLPNFFQQVAKTRSQTTLPGDTNEATILSYTLPALGANAMIKVRTLLSGLTNNANAKTVRVNLNGSGAGTGAAIDCASNTAANFEIECRNANATNAQKWITNAKANWGAFSGSLQSTTRELGTAGVVLTLTGQKGVNTDAMVFEWADFWLCGGGD